jgi:hypothetical protein
MSTFDYAEMQAVAEELIGEFGNPGKIMTMSTPDQVEGGDPVPVEHDCSVVIMGYDQRYVNGSTILAGDVQLYISAIGLAVEPQVGMLVSAGGKTYLIVNMDPTKPDGVTPVVFSAQGRIAG